MLRFSSNLFYLCITMEESTSKEKVLKNVREALISKTDPPFPRIDLDRPIFATVEESPDVNFAQELTAAGGLFIYCEKDEEVIEGLRFLFNDRHWDSIFAPEPAIVELLRKSQIPCVFEPDKLTETRVAMTRCESLIARLGSVLVSTGQMAGRRVFVYPDVHIVLAHASQLVGDIKDALANLRKKYDRQMPSMVTLITGPSRTADIEKTLVMGAHGPKELYVFFLEDRL
ncbi:MAG TPA: LUD domain-containing protein [Bacteroidales bacterium]|nr:LUD domain-containing protein [Bacteroidales bacterium]HOX79174.1 LUD domain-containing protein [Bacteroidales bacterium]HPI84996.1 LUD domain-containing protein [Bacteroidales bacterium]HPM92416.1 LUD domain-containing protein [Bacteroidales bacterium]